MSQLSRDLERYADEAFNKKDLKAGFKLVGEITGIVALGGLAVTAVTVWLPGLNIVVPAGVIAKTLSMAAQQYSHLDEVERKQIRMVARVLNGGIGGISSLFK
nr:hypothetical protein [uncultured Draconibacterium sp.]